MARFKVVVIEHGYASIDCERDIIAKAGGELISANELPREKALALAEDADGVLFRRGQVPAEMIRRFKRAKGIVRYGIGIDNVDLAAATAAGIIVGHVPAYCVDEVSTHAIALLLACVRRLVSMQERMRRGEWDVHRVDPVYRVAGKTLGIVGFGKLGKAVARKLGDWDLRLLAADPFAEAAHGAEIVDLATLCRESDFITLHAPLLPETRHLISHPELALMKRGVILVNTARGPVLDTTALLAVIESGKIAQAGLDVFEEEPLPADSPLRRHPKILVTDHMAWYSEESQADLQRTAAEEIATICSGRLPGSIANPEVLYKLGRFEEWQPSESARWQLKRLRVKA
ncbi:MAG TPA: C-terminal binding protein [Candidatus Binatia bacterium]|nr:C-terminal binding protein [Candidatus Binatia bacterium]